MKRREFIGNKPHVNARQDAWVREGGELPSTPNDRVAAVNREGFTARLTIDITPTMRGRIKMAAFSEGLTVAEVLRALFEREYPHRDGRR